VSPASHSHSLEIPLFTYSLIHSVLRQAPGAKFINAKDTSVGGNKGGKEIFAQSVGRAVGLPGAASNPDRRAWVENRATSGKGLQDKLEIIPAKKHVSD
jgi:hypothetical protein